MAYEKGSRPEGGFKRRGPARRRKKVCVFCGTAHTEIDYKDAQHGRRSAELPQRSRKKRRLQK